MTARRAILCCRECGSPIMRGRCPQGCAATADRFVLWLLTAWIVTTTGLVVAWLILSGIRLPAGMGDRLAWIVFVVLAVWVVRETVDERPSGRRVVIATLAATLVAGVLLWWGAAL